MRGEGLQRCKVRRNVRTMQQFPAQAKVALVLDRSKLDALAKSAGIATDDELAGVLGTNPSTLWRITNRMTNPSNEFMARCITAFPYASLDSLFHKVEVPDVEVAV
jgi:hypothetical protein